MKNKFIILLVRRHAGEVDWILPLLYKFNLRNYKIVTIFSDSGSFESLKNNSEIYQIWKKINYSFIIISKYDSLFWKILKKLISNSFLQNIVFLKNYKNKIFSKIFDIEKYKKKLKLNISNIKAIFAPNIHFSNLPFLFKFYNSNLSIIRFPESAMLSASKKENPHLKYNLSFRNIYGDLFLFPSKSDKDFLLGENSKKKIYYCGFLRHQNWWVRKFVAKKKEDLYFRFLIALRNPQKNYLHKSSFIEMIESIMSILSKINNIRVVFKVHPQDKNICLLNSILSKYEKNIWTFKKNHMIKLASQSDACITIVTSACLDSLAAKIPTLEYYKIDSELERSPNVTSCVHMTFSSNKEWNTIFKKKKLVTTARNYDELESNINLIVRKNYSRINNANQKHFQKMVNKNADSAERTANYIEKNFFNKN